MQRNCRKGHNYQTQAEYRAACYDVHPAEPGWLVGTCNHCHALISHETCDHETWAKLRPIGIQGGLHGQDLALANCRACHTTVSRPACHEDYAELSGAALETLEQVQAAVLVRWPVPV